MGIVRSRVERQFQEEWRGLIAIYLFFGGVGGGAYVVAAAGSLLGPTWAPITTAGLWLSWLCIGVGMLFLTSHLGKPFRAPLAMAKVGSSWISRGVWILSIFGALALIHTFAFPGGEAPIILPVLGMFFAAFTMLYTGALVSAAKGFPLWRTGILPVLFLISGLLTGLFAVVLGMVVMESSIVEVGHLKKLAAIGAGLSVVELLVIFFFLHSAYKLRDTKEAAQRITGKASFIFGDLILGLAVPFVLCLAVFFGMDEVSAMINTMVVAAILGLIGGFLLRNAILSAGMQTSLDFAGFKFRPISKVDFQHSPIGKMPPQ
ncbi:MAG: dimethyl sulfoxide reductase anchor subunit [Myxococcota bacterium]|nr:dimethyl sulfoxide reductase anchor subunit [Myxococcota bacterium]